MKLFELLFFLTVVGKVCGGSGGGVKLVAIAGRDVVLPCSLGAEQDIEPALFDWKTKDGREVFLYDAGTHYNNGRLGQDEQFKGRVSHFPDELINGNASIVIRKTRLSDSGNYTCVFPFIQRQTFHVELVVGATPKPRVMILSITEDKALLQCEVRGASPKPQMKWLDSDGNVLPAVEKLEDLDDPSYPPALTLQTTVTKTDSFHCVVTQQELNHVARANIYAHICGDRTNMRSHGVSTVVLASLAALLLVSFLVLVLLIFLRSRRRALRADKNFKLRVHKDPRHLMEKNNMLNVPKDPLRFIDRSDSGVSSLHSSSYPEKSQSREYIEPVVVKVGPDVCLKINLHEPQKMDASFKDKSSVTSPNHVLVLTHLEGDKK